MEKVGRAITRSTEWQFQLEKWINQEAPARIAEMRELPPARQFGEGISWSFDGNGFIKWRKLLRMRNRGLVNRVRCERLVDYSQDQWGHLGKDEGLGRVIREGEERKELRKFDGPLRIEDETELRGWGEERIFARLDDYWTPRASRPSTGTGREWIIRWERTNHKKGDCVGRTNKKGQVGQRKEQAAARQGAECYHLHVCIKPSIIYLASSLYVLLYEIGNSAPCYLEIQKTKRGNKQQKTAIFLFHHLQSTKYQPNV